MQFRTFLEARQRGKSLSETGYKWRNVFIFRAAAANVSTLAGNDEYVTLSEKFAREHADHQAAVNEEPYTVFKYMVQAADVYEAYNPGEYFYSGTAVQGKSIYTATGMTEAAQYSYMSDDGDVDADDDSLPEDWIQQLNQMVSASGINILSDKNLAVLVHENGKVLGALYVAYDHNDGEYSFDIVGEQGGNWVGMNLIKIGLDMFHDYAEYNPNSHIKLDVRNQRLVPILQNRFGLVVTGKDPASKAVFMALRNQNT